MTTHRRASPGIASLRVLLSTLASPLGLGVRNTSASGVGIGTSTGTGTEMGTAGGTGGDNDSFVSDLATAIPAVPCLDRQLIARLEMPIGDLREVIRSMVVDEMVQELSAGPRRPSPFEILGGLEGGGSEPREGSENGSSSSEDDEGDEDEDEGSSSSSMGSLPLRQRRLQHRHRHLEQVSGDIDADPLSLPPPFASPSDGIRRVDVQINVETDTPMGGGANTLEAAWTSALFGGTTE